MHNQNTDSWETTDVVICGCGPTGAMLSALLGQASVPNIVLERDRVIATDPRGIALDEDGMRLLQGIGLYDEIFRDIGSCMGRLMFISGRHHDLHVKPFFRFDATTSEGGTGHPGLLFHKQPSMEKHLRLAARHTPYAELRSECTISSISEDVDWVYVVYHNAITGEDSQIRCKFLVGADGKTGFVRKRYLEPKGITLERASATPYEEIWVAVNIRFTLPTPNTHPDFPLWALGFSSDDVYDAFVPREFRFLCNPDRSAVCGRFGLHQDRLWRFEYVVLNGENAETMAQTDKFRRVVWPYLTQSGKRYGLTDDVQYPEDCIEVLRASSFTFSARSCNKWSLGRVILCGDAAHVFPPFGGQGIASGFRDASALSWRLQLATRPSFHNHTALLAGWAAERKQQLERSLAVTVANGAAVTERNWLKAAVRDWYLWGVQLVPSWRRQLEAGARKDGMVRYNYQEGMAFLPGLGGGACFPQVYCVQLGGGADTATRVRFTDDLIFAGGKKAHFQIVVLLRSIHELASAEAALSDIDALLGHELSAAETTYIVHDTESPEPDQTSPATAAGTVCRVATAQEFAESPLCVNRPVPQYYDPHRLWREARGKRFFVLRPDRFVFAACGDGFELREAARGVLGLVKGEALVGAGGGVERSRI